MKLKFKALLAATLVVGTVAVTSIVPGDGGGGTVWTVTPTGTGNHSLATAQQNAQPGDTVQLEGTFHTSLVPKVSGTATSPIMYVSGPSGATFDAAGLTSPLVSISKSYIIVNGVRFTNTAYQTAPAANRGFIIRGSHNTVVGCTFNYSQMQLIGADYNEIRDNVWREFVARYVKDSSGVLQPQTAGDMLNLVSGSDYNEIVGNDMKWAGHSLIEVGNGFGGANAHNSIHDNVLSNPWYKTLILADDGGQTTIESNQLLDANSTPTLYSTIAGQVGQLQTSSDGSVQFSGDNFILSNNTISGSVSTYGTISLGARYYTQSGTTYLIESRGNQIYQNTVTGNQGAASVSFLVFRASSDPVALPQITGNDIHDNVFSGNTPSTFSALPGHTTFLYHAASWASPWLDLNGNLIHLNQLETFPNAYKANTTYNGVTKNQVYDLQQFEALDPAHVWGNSTP